MKFPFYIGRRYLFSKKSHNAINIISFISVCGIAVATMALVCTLSVFNGFENLVSQMFSVFDPDLKVQPATGKVFDVSDAKVQKAVSLPEVEVAVQTLEENALLKYGEKQSPVLVRGVSDNFRQAVDVSRLLVVGGFDFKQGDLDYAALALGLASRLDARTEYITPIELFSPIRAAKVNLANPSTAFVQRTLFPCGVFTQNDSKLEESLLLVSMDVARDMFRYDEGTVSSLDIKLRKGADAEQTKHKIQSLLGERYEVKNRFEQQADTFKMVQVEKWVTFFILTFVAIIAIFNVIGSLTMLIIEKERDIATLQSLGASNKVIASVFMIEGWLISLIGATIGIVMGLILCVLQETFGFLKLNAGGAAYLVDAYPVEVRWSDLTVIFFSVILIGFLAVLLPANSLKKRLDYKQ